MAEARALAGLTQTDLDGCALDRPLGPRPSWGLGPTTQRGHVSALPSVCLGFSAPPRVVTLHSSHCADPAVTLPRTTGARSPRTHPHASPPPSFHAFCVQKGIPV